MGWLPGRSEDAVHCWNHARRGKARNSRVDEKRARQGKGFASRNSRLRENARRRIPAHRSHGDLVGPGMWPPPLIKRRGGRLRWSQLTILSTLLFSSFLLPSSTRKQLLGSLELIDRSALGELEVDGEQRVTRWNNKSGTYKCPEVMASQVMARVPLSSVRDD